MLRINSVQINFNDVGIMNVNINFRVDDSTQENSMYFSGNVTVPFDLYNQDNSIEGMRNLVTQQIMNRINQQPDQTGNEQIPTATLQGQEETQTDQPDQVEQQEVVRNQRRNDRNNQ